MNFGCGAQGHWRSLTDSERFKNVRAEMHWVARKGLQDGVFQIPRIERKAW